MYVCVCVISGEAVKLSVVSMEGKASHKQELVSGLLDSLAHTAPGVTSRGPEEHPIGSLD